MRVLHVLGRVTVPPNPQEAPVSGVVRACIEIAREQSRRGWRVSVMYPARAPTESRWEGVTLMGRPPLWIDGWPRLSSHGEEWAYHGRVVAETWRRRYDVVHGHGSGYLRYVRAGLRVAHLHFDPDVSLNRRDLQTIDRHAHAIVVVNARVASDLARKGLRPTKVYVARNGTDLRPAADPTEGEAMRSRLNLPQSAFVVLFVGAIVPEKGVRELARAFHLLSAGADGPYLVLAGASGLWGSGRNTQTAYEEDCCRILDAPAIRARVRALGLVGRKEVAALYNMASVLVVPSQGPDAAPLVVLEGMASGTPILATEVGGIPEYLGDAGLLTPSDYRSLASGLSQLREDRRLRGAMSARGRMRAIAYTWAATATEIERVYRNGLAYHPR